MGLMAECLDYVGQLLVVEPGYGWGWVFGPGSPFSDYAQIDAMGSFRVRIKEFQKVSGELRGGTGVIEEPGCPIDGALIAFTTRSSGEVNFTSRIGQYNLNIGSSFLQVETGQVGAVGPPSLQGFARIMRPK